MTGDIMDKVLGKFEVKQFNPIGEKFNANEQEAIYAIENKEKENDSVDTVIQTGWRIGDRLLRAAKVGIIKNTPKS